MIISIELRELRTEQMKTHIRRGLRHSTKI
jgi:hypothetical protein